MPDSDIQRLVERMTPTAIYVQWSDDGQHIRKWSHEPFDGGTAFVVSGTITALRAEVARMRADLEVATNGLQSVASWGDAAMGHLSVSQDMRKSARKALQQIDATK